jgi:dihydrofolate reductase
MPKLTFDISVSLDGYVAGPDATQEEPLGKGGEQLHKWVVGLDAWRKSHGYEGGDRTSDSEVLEEVIAAPGAVIMGRRMFSGDGGPWGEPPHNGWWGDDPPFAGPVFVLTHHPREPLVMQGREAFIFVTDGIESALERARAAAGEKDVAIAGGADVIGQYLAAGHVDEFQLHVVPVLLGGGARLFDGVGPLDRFAVDRVRESPAAVTHLRYRVTAP